MREMLWDRLVRRPLWLITGYRAGQMEVLTIITGGDNVETLPVFSFKEEAELFLWFEAAGMGWWIRQTTPGELISVLYGPCASVERVALDPSAEIVAEGMAALMSLSRKDFVQTLSGEGRVVEPQQSCLWRSRPSSSVSLELGGGINHC